MGLFRPPPIGPYRGGQPFGSQNDVGPIAPVGSGRNITVGAGSVTITGYAPTVTRSGVNGNLITAPLKNNTTTLQSGLSGLVVLVLDSSGNLIIRKTGQITDISGVLTVNDASITVGIQYHVVVLDPVSHSVGMTSLITGS